MYFSRNNKTKIESTQKNRLHFAEIITIALHRDLTQSRVDSWAIDRFDETTREF